MSPKAKLGLVDRLHYFLSRGVWQIDVLARPRVQRPFIRLIRFGWSVYKGFEGNVGSLHASALTYYTLFAIVPMLAVGLALARVFDGEEIARREIHQHVVGRIVSLPEPTGGTNAATAVTHDTNETQRLNREFSERVVAVEDRLFSQVGGQAEHLRPPRVDRQQLE